ncbi:actin-related protein 2/3 complex subunit 3-B [Strongylocentrotus purpuratus]|uniref:Actin-related protein 2/3 complex subunit 3 n=1 Tax=Strongylocentrotus purpuratus TaxID=7668 RepID=A0A7M7PAI8_STRPU|nr:actin-related protein 2/3 complex subunit 3-B-like isoform X2 [Strongylocentrotus purpuratus]XP_787369.1 actin-related protein 2/3 complex subunit 3-B [Strongylocentrotus purpuratus]|eukprot:XP_787369.1 PREDICTED: actin-related protein 2/3 complex subunit 3 [Strongylocentrotus purpuratus]
MPAYHSQFTDAQLKIGNLALLPLRTKFRGPAPTNSSDDSDIIDEALTYFKANVFFKNFEIKSDADRVLIYITLYITECLKKMQKCASRNEAQKEMTSLAIAKFSIPGEAGFPLNAIYLKPTNRAEEDQMRAYVQQIRQETGQRLVDKVLDPATSRPSKFWMCFTKRKFMDRSLSGPGQ